MELHGKRMILKEVCVDDAQKLLPVFNSDEQFNRWSGLQSSMSLEAIRAEIGEALTYPDGATWQIENETGMRVGVAETTLLHPPHGGYIALLLIHRDFQRRGYGSEAASLLEDYFFSSPEVTHIGLGVLVANTPAQVFWEKRGYVRGKQTHDQHGNATYEYRLARRTT